MNRTKIVLAAVIMASSLLAGCSSKGKTDKVSSDSQAQTVNAKVDQVSNDMNALRSEVEAVRSDAARANSRLDNMAHHYKK